MEAVKTIFFPLILLAIRIKSPSTFIFLNGKQTLLILHTPI